MGANDLNRVNKGVNTALGIGCVYSVASFLILRVLDKALIGLFLESSQTEIMANAQSFIFWNSVFYIPLAVLIIYRYTIQGLGYSSLAMFAGVAEMIARALVGFLFVPLWGYFAACIANPGGMVLCLLLPDPGVYRCVPEAETGKSKTARKLVKIEPLFCETAEGRLFCCLVGRPWRRGKASRNAKAERLYRAGPAQFLYK
mgnify:CR=1 FL=1